MVISKDGEDQLVNQMYCSKLMNTLLILLHYQLCLSQQPSKVPF